MPTLLYQEYFKIATQYVFITTLNPQKISKKQIITNIL